jgi:hypothetical protein
MKGGLTAREVHQDKDDYEISLQCDGRTVGRKDCRVSALALTRGLLDRDPIISENRSRPVDRST